MRVPVTQQENGHGALVRDTVNELAAELRAAMKQSGENSQADKVWLALASWLRNNTMMPLARALANGQTITHPVFADGRIYVFRLKRVQHRPRPMHDATLTRAEDNQQWAVRH